MHIRPIAFLSVFCTGLAFVMWGIALVGLLEEWSLRAMTLDDIAAATAALMAMGLWSTWKRQLAEEERRRRRAAEMAIRAMLIRTLAAERAAHGALVLHRVL